MRRPTTTGGLALVAVLGLVPHAAEAQVRWDAELTEGVERRVLTSKPPGAGDASGGPLLEASAHVALIPLVRVGLYAHYDASPVVAQDTRDIYSGGLDLRLVFPWLRRDVRAYMRVGIGEAMTYAPAHAFVAEGSRPTSLFLAASHGAFTEVPVALGVLYRVQPRLAFMAEAGTRVGLAFAGSAYRSGSASGDDALAVFVDVGVMWGR